MADKPFTIIGVNSDQEIGRKTLEQIRAVSKEKSLTWRSFQNTDPEVKISTTWNVKGWPTTYLIDKDGKIRYKNLRGEGLDKALEELMGEMGHEVSLVGVDHEAEDEAAMAAAKAEREKPEESSEEDPEKETSKDDDSEKKADEKPEAKKSEEKASEDKAEKKKSEAEKDDAK